VDAAEIKRLQSGADDRWFQYGHRSISAPAGPLFRHLAGNFLPPPRPAVNLKRTFRPPIV
jgi:hypothetical protein